MPEPLVPIHVWRKVKEARLAPHGLKMSDDGKISQRSYTDTLRQMLTRDAAHLQSNFPIERHMQLVWGIDHASIIGARDFTHGGISLGPILARSTSRDRIVSAN